MYIVTCIKKDDLIKYALDNGIDLIGFASPNCLKKYRNLLIMRDKNKLSCSIEEKNFEKRINPYLIMANVKSIITIGLSYNVDYKRNNDVSSSGIISKTSWGIDYHTVLYNALDKIKNYIISKCENADAKILVDNNPLLERAIAYHGGIGFFGKNNLIINEIYGSNIFLGEILTNIYFKPNKPIKSKCGDCNLCIKACPGKAIISSHIINTNNCISYSTVDKGYLNDERIKRMGRRIYGCDICQDVCPFNKKAKKVKRNEFMPNKLKPNVSIRDILSLDNKKFKDVFGQTSSSWRGKRTIIRNAIIAAINKKDKGSIDILRKLLKYNPSSYLKAYSAYALSKLGDKNFLNDIEDAYRKEKDHNAKVFIKKAIDILRGVEFENKQR